MPPRHDLETQLPPAAGGKTASPPRPPATGTLGPAGRRGTAGHRLLLWNGHSWTLLIGPRENSLFPLRHPHPGYFLFQQKVPVLILKTPQILPTSLSIHVLTRSERGWEHADSFGHTRGHRRRTAHMPPNGPRQQPPVNSHCRLLSVHYGDTRALAATPNTPIPSQVFL